MQSRSKRVNVCRSSIEKFALSKIFYKNIQHHVITKVNNHYFQCNPIIILCNAKQILISNILWTTENFLISYVVFIFLERQINWKIQICLRKQWIYSRPWFFYRILVFWRLEGEKHASLKHMKKKIIHQAIYTTRD